MEGREYCHKGGKVGGSHEPKTPAPRSPTPRRGDALPRSSRIPCLSPLCRRRAESGRLWSGGRELESVAFGCSSLHSEPTGLFHRYQQLLVELFVRLIRWNVDPVKAGTGQKGESHCWESLALGPAARAAGRQAEHPWPPASCEFVPCAPRWGWGKEEGKALFPGSEGW